MTNIVVDFRESALIAQFRSNEVNITEENLEIGDVHVVSETCTLIFERKTMSDLAASLKDGRYKEQKHRMLSHHKPHHITYIIEGGQPVTNDDKYGLSRSVYDGVYIYTMYRDGIHVIHVRDVSETAKWIANVATKIIQHPEKFENTTKDYVFACKAKSRRIENMTPENCYTLQLCQIPGISLKIAKTIRDVYPNMRELIQALTASSNPCELIAKLPLIGTKKAKLIVSYLTA